MKVWLIKIGEILPVEPGQTLIRNGLLAKTLASQNHEVTWWASSFSHQHKRYLFDTPRVIQVQPNLELRLLFGPPYHKNVSPQRILHHLVVAQNFAREARSASKPDIIFCSLPTLELAEQALSYGQTMGVPVIIDVVDTWPDVYLTILPSVLRPAGRLALWSEFQRLQKVCSSADALTGVSKTYLDWALKHAGRSLDRFDGVFPLGCSMNPLSKLAVKGTSSAQVRAKYGASSQDLLVTFVGIFGASYDLETVVETAKILAQRNVRDVRFVLAGTGDKMKRLLHMAQGLTNVIFPGWLAEQPMRELLYASSVGLAAYTQDALQSLPNKPFEYMAAGLPMLSSLTGELEQLIRTEGIGLQYRSGDHASLAKQIHWCRDNPDQLKLMSDQAYRVFEARYDSTKIYEKLAAHLEAVVNRA